MNKAIESLVQDHWFLRRALNALECFTRASANAGTIHRGDLKKFADFFQVYGDVHHATKEEDVLFPSLSRAGIESWEAGPLADARRDNRQERYLMRVLDHYAARDGEYDAGRLRELQSEVDTFLHSMRRHLTYEEEHIFPLVALLPLPQQRELAETLAAFDAGSPSVEQCEPMRQVCAELAERYVC